MTAVRIYTDGACSGNPGPGGWAYILIRGGARTEKSGAEPRQTTNNHMEMRAAIEALSAIGKASDVQLTTDSQYLVSGMTEWLPRWKHSNWQTADGKPVKNRLQWEELDRQCQRHRVSWQWVRGHSGDADNERCNVLANEQAGIKDGDEWWLEHNAEKCRRKHEVRDQEGQTRQSAPDKGSEAGLPIQQDVFGVIDEIEAGSAIRSEAKAGERR